MIGTLFTLTNKAHPERTITINDHTDPLNFIALQAYPTMELDVRVDERPKEGQHGIWDFFSYYGKRVITFEGVIIGEDEEAVTTIKDTLMNVVNFPSQPTSSDDGTVVISWTDPRGRDVQIDAKISAYPSTSRDLGDKMRLDFQLIFKAPSPEIVSQSVIEVDGIRGYTRGDFMVPFEVPFTLGVDYVNKFNVENEGSVIADVVYRLYGGAHYAITNPRITNVTTGEFMQVDTSLADGTKYVEINTKDGTVLDQDGVDLSGSVHAGSSFPKLAVGSNDIFYSSDESPYATGVQPDEIVDTEHRFAML